MLNRIALKGFKSFAGATELEFGPGINVVVGPNGSGKSNLSEAVVWALGEQRAGQLRAGTMEDVLYSGSEGRKGAQIAEISLQFSPPENTEGPELEISRRLTRAGDSGYSINGGGCRLLDVQDALATRGLGPSSLAIIRQGRVEAICTSSPQDRRAMLDEAAGVAAAKRRRRRAELKLARIADQLDRARDLEKELTGQARRLKRQASAAERAARLDDEIVALRAALRSARIARAGAEHAAAEREKQQGAAFVSRAQAAVETARTALATAERERSEFAERASLASQRAIALRATAERLSGRAELARERVREAEDRRERREAERQSARSRLEEAREVRRGAAETDATARAGAESSREKLRAVEAAVEKARAAREDSRSRHDAAAAEAQEAERALSSVTASLERADATASRARQSLAELPVDVDEALIRAEKRADISARRSHLWSGRTAEAVRAAADATAAIDAAEEARRSLEADQRALAPGDGIAGSVFGDSIDVDEGFEDAVDAALGAHSDAVPVGSLTEGLAALAGGADTALLPASSPPGYSTPPGARPLRDVVRGADLRTNMGLDRLLAQAWLVDDLATVPPGATGLWVTPDGQALRPGIGVLTGARGSWLRRVRARRLESSLAAARRDCDACAEIRDVTARVAVRAEARLRAVHRAAAASQQELERRRAAASGIAGRRQEAEDAIRAGGEAHAAAAVERRRLVAARDGAIARVTALGKEVAEARETADEKDAAWRAAQAATVDADSARAAAKTELAEIDARIVALRATIASGGDADGEGIDGDGAAAALEAAAAALAPHCERATSAAREGSASVTGGDERLGDLRSAFERASGELESARTAAHETEVALAVASERLAEARRPPDGADGDEMAESVKEPTALPDGVDPSDPEAIGEHLAEAERKRSTIGPVNLLAVEERVELEERAGDLEAQITDLDESATKLTAHLAELDTSVAEGFDAVFKQVSDRFATVAEQLFPGGAGRLRAVTDEEGEPGIEVEVIPHNKRARPLSLLSGGERSLVALAFCLALAMARPAPFYLLDEVEAALDDVNLRRFLGVVRALAKETQFVLITHQQPTVEIADTIFGVTMGSDGASQIVSRRLAQDVEGPARKYVRRELHAVPGGA